MAGYNPLQTLQAMRHQQAMNDQAFKDQQYMQQAAQAQQQELGEREERAAVYERLQTETDRKERASQQTFDNGITLMEKEAELSEQLGRDIRGDLGYMTTGGSVVGDEPGRRAQIAGAGAESERISGREAAEAKFLAAKQKRKSSLEDKMFMTDYNKGSPEERAASRGTVQRGREIRNVGGEGREGRAADLHPHKKANLIARTKATRAGGSGGGGGVSGDFRNRRDDIKRGFGARIKKLSGTAGTEYGAGIEAIGRDEDLMMDEQFAARDVAKGQRAQAGGKATLVKGHLDRVLQILNKHARSPDRNAEKEELMSYGQQLEAEFGSEYPSVLEIKRYILEN